MIRKIGDAIRVKDDELGVVEGKIVRFGPNGTPVAQFADGTKVVVTEDMIVYGRPARPAPQPKPVRKSKPGSAERLREMRLRRSK